jgi:plasmid stabilization system protein ParE
MLGRVSMERESPSPERGRLGAWALPTRDDLRAIVAFIEQDSPGRAVIFRDRLLAEAESLARLPFRGVG